GNETSVLPRSGSTMAIHCELVSQRTTMVQERGRGQGVPMVRGVVDFRAEDGGLSTSVSENQLSGPCKIETPKDPFHSRPRMDDYIQVILEGSEDDEEDGMIDYFLYSAEARKKMSKQQIQAPESSSSSTSASKHKSAAMLRRKSEVYQNILRIVPRTSSRTSSRASQSSSTLATASKGTSPSHILSPPTPPPRIRSNNSIITSSLYHHHQNQSHVVTGSSRPKPNPTWLHRSYHSSKHQHHHIRPSAVKRSKSVHDPELVACMERWIRIVVTGQRRAHSSLAKPALNTSGSSYSVSDIRTSSATLSRDRLRNSGPRDALASLEPFPTPATTTIPPSTSPSTTLATSFTAATTTTTTTTTTTESASTLSLERFLQSLDRIPIQDHELPKFFRSSFSDASRRKPTLSRSYRRAIDNIWSVYLALSTTKDGATRRLTRWDYTKLMQIVRHSDGPQLAASRILALQRDMDRNGIEKHRKVMEMLAQAHLVLGSVPEALRLYRETTEMVGEGTLQHKKVVWTMVDGFAANSLEIEGIAFLDGLPTVAISDEERDFYYTLYQRLCGTTESLLRNFGTSATCQCLPRSVTSIEQFMRYPSSPRLSSLAGTLYVFRTDDQRRGLVRGFSQMVAGLLVKMGDTRMMTLLLQGLLQECQLLEASRVLELMLRQGLEPELDNIRRHLVCSEFENGADRVNLELVLEEWEAISTLRTKHMPGASSSSDLGSEFLHMQDVRTIIEGYSNILTDCIREDDLLGALRTTRFMVARGWNEAMNGIDFRRLNSRMVNHGRSETYPDYLQVRYTLGGPSAPDLHTYRRLIYAACRRSDLFSALTLFKQVRTKHPSWTLDTTLYNAIISTAGTTGHIRVAEKTFACLLEDGLAPDHYSFHGLLNGYGHSGDLEAAVLIPQQMVKHKLSPTTKTFNLIMKAYLGSRGDLTTSRKLFQVMQRSGKAVPPDLVTFNQLLEGYRRSGNLMWFDAYFDRYFGPQDSSTVASNSTWSSRGGVATADSRQADSKPCAGSIGAPYRPFQQLGQKTDSCRAALEIVKPEKTDDKTLLIQLKHSLLLTSIDTAIVWELWHTLHPRLAPVLALGSSFASGVVSGSSPSVGTRMDGTTSETNTTTMTATTPSVPKTHVPFKKLLGGVSMAATDSDHFRFTALSLFRSAFLSRGETKGVRRVDGLVARLFPDHPTAQKTLTRRFRAQKSHPTLLPSSSNGRSTKSK
ncbi:hypothetical protein BGX30_014836, partial [Mortierella sp. GBA39]